ncbi:hypothetical protein [Nocardia noduli]|uniref:hypothetical protein n=1 Tax=Nocardia noduli TaxID=2815722 RepID=UPI001C229DED|nr:hypothetical protein [Nocardia noduli]
MLNSYKDLSRWYGALEPDAATSAPVAGDDAIAEPTNEDERSARFPDYIREEDPEESRAKAEVPTDLPARRSEFIGGWSDWVADDHAPGPDDDYDPRSGVAVRFPWPDDNDADDDPAEEPPSPRNRSAPALRVAAKQHPATRRARVVLVLIVAVLMLIAAGVGALWLVQMSGQRGAAGTTPASMQFTAGSARAGGPADCPTEHGVSVLRSAEAGSTDSGPDVVLAFQYAYYVARSGEQVRAVVAPEAPISSPEVIQRGIDTVPEGTTHCVRVVTVTENRYSVEVTEYRPGGVPATYNKQMVTTAVIGGRTLITGIAAG